MFRLDRLNRLTIEMKSKIFKKLENNERYKIKYYVIYKIDNQWY